MIFPEHHWMKLALEEAEAALREDEVPVGAVIVMNGVLIGRGHNRMRSLNDPTAHAEMIAITAACDYAQSPRLEGSEIFVTLEPCSMCAGAMVLARMKKVYFGLRDDKTGACGSVFDIVRDPRMNHQMEVYDQIREDECRKLIELFFAQKRKKNPL